jgi:DNA-binding response OmpR family regulator
MNQMLVLERLLRDQVIPWVLLVEDCPDLGTVLPLHLKDAGYEVDLATGGRHGLELAKSGKHQLIILDLGLPEVDGMEICRMLRQSGVRTSLLMLTARSSEIDRVLGLELGADDYLTKPFSIRELLARVRAIMRRTQPNPHRQNLEALEVLKLGRLTLNVGERSVRIADKPVELTAKEFDLLLHFVRYPGRVFTRSHLLDQVWGYSHIGYDHTVNTHINRLRSKIEDDPLEPRFILTVWGVGYKYNSQAE